MTALRDLKQTLIGHLSKLKTRSIHWLALELAEDRQRSIRWNAMLHSTAIIEREGTIENFRGGAEHIKLGAHTHLRGRLLTYAHSGQISIGDWSYIGVRTEIWSMNAITIGNRVLIAHDVNIHDGTAHSLNAQERHLHYRQMLESGHPHSAEQLPGVQSAPIVIEDDAWISFGVTILQGVRIGAGSVVAARSIVTQDIPPGMIYRCQVTPILRSLEERANFGAGGDI